MTTAIGHTLYGYGIAVFTYALVHPGQDVSASVTGGALIAAGALLVASRDRNI